MNMLTLWACIEQPDPALPAVLAWKAAWESHTGTELTPPPQPLLKKLYPRHTVT